jgi:hypothetical protein
VHASIYIFTIIVTVDGFRLVIGFTELLKLVTTSKDCAVTVLHTSQIAIGHTRSSQHVAVFTRRCSVMASNGGLSPSTEFPNCPGLSYQLLRATAHND